LSLILDESAGTLLKKLESTWLNRETGIIDNKKRNAFI
jgi:hypothetical protein